MMVPSDKGYAMTMLIKQGEAMMVPQFRPLAEWISNTYDVRLLNIIYDASAKGRRPNLRICLAFEADISVFRAKNSTFFDAAKQDQIACQFKKSMASQNRVRGNDFMHFMKGSPSGVYKTENIGITYTCIAMVMPD